jgi:hypothetical protein
MLEKTKDYLSPIKNFIPWKRHKLNGTQLESSPFFIVGSGRSGTTLLRRILIQNPSVHIPPETYVLGRMIRTCRRNGGLVWHDFIHLILAKLEHHNEFYTFNISNLGELYRELRHVPENKRTLAFIVDSLYHFHANKIGVNCDVWGDKTPMNSLYVDEINKLFPNAKFIFMVRNGYDVVYSYFKNGMYDKCYNATMRWKESNEKVLNFQNKYPDKVHRIYYEDMVSNPKKYVPPVFSFLNIDYKEEFLHSSTKKQMGDVEKLSHHYNINKKINTNSIGKGRDKIPTKELKKVDVIINSLNKRLGYDKI